MPSTAQTILSGKKHYLDTPIGKFLDVYRGLENIDSHTIEEGDTYGAH